MHIYPEKTQAIMIDMQEKLLAAMPDPEGLVRRTGILISGLSVLGVPVTVTQQYTKGLGKTDGRLMQACGTEEYYDKITYSCWEDDHIREAVSALPERKTVLLFGVETHVCVWQTARDLLENGYDVQIVCDCVESRKTIDKETAFRRMEQAGAVLTTVEACLFDMLKTAGTPEFKAVSKLVKQLF